MTVKFDLAKWHCTDFVDVRRALAPAAGGVLRNTLAADIGTGWVPTDSVLAVRLAVDTRVGVSVG